MPTSGGPSRVAVIGCVIMGHRTQALETLKFYSAEFGLINPHEINHGRSEDEIREVETDGTETGNAESDVAKTVTPERRGCLRRLFFAGMLLVAFAGAAWWGLNQFLDQQPQFYAAAIRANPQQQQRDGSELERKLLDLHNASQTIGQWSAEFSEDQVNGWLAVGMHEKFPELMPAEFVDPRVDFNDGRFSGAFRSQVPGLRGVLSVEADLFLTPQLNEIGVRLYSIKLGALPLPVQSFHEEVTAELAKQGVKVGWSEEAGDPVMLIQLPDRIVERSSGVWIELLGIELVDDALRVTGQSNPLEF